MCNNEYCDLHKKKVKQKSSIDFCPSCGAKLVYVCAHCFSEIEDLEPSHRIYLSCEAKREARIEKAKQQAKKTAVAVGTAVVGVVVATAESEAFKVIRKGTKEVINKIIK